METLNELVKSGKIRYIGVSNFSVAQMEEARAYADVVSLQALYNLLQRGVEQGEYPYTERAGMGFIPYSPLAQGLLTGKFSRETRLPDNDVRRRYLKKESLKRIWKKWRTSARSPIVTKSRWLNWRSIGC